MIKIEDLECKYCKPGSIIDISGDLPIRIEVDPDGYIISIYNGIHEAIKINYCPICGKKLKKEIKNVR